jgi:hypothetical protein
MGLFQVVTRVKVCHQLLLEANEWRERGRERQGGREGGSERERDRGREGGREERVKYNIVATNLIVLIT